MRRAPGTASDGRTSWSCSTRGISVYTTLNVQHIESLNDVVAKITGVVVRETVPDSVLERADEIELVDLSPDDLLERCRRARSTSPSRRRRPSENFFRKGNLIALRELALRRTAERVDAQMRAYMRDHAIGKTWPVAERILVCVGPSPFSPQLVRAGHAWPTGSAPSGSWRTWRRPRTRACSRPTGTAWSRRCGSRSRWRGDGHAERPDHERGDSRLRARAERQQDRHRQAGRGRSGSASCSGPSWMRSCAAAARSTSTSSAARGSPRRCGRRRVQPRAPDWASYGVAMAVVAVCTAWRGRCSPTSACPT